MRTFLRTTLAPLLLLLTATASADPYRVESSGEGRAVYLVPGLASPGWVWDDLAARLRAAGYRTHVLILAGFAGEPPLDGDGPFLPRVRDALAAELEAGPGGRPVVIGHSLGGFLAFWLAATEPDRLAGAIAVDGVPFYSGLAGEDVTAESQRPAAAQMASFMASLTDEQFAQQNRMSLQVMVADPGQRARVAEDSARSDPATVGRAVAEIMTTDLRPLMSGVDVPVLLVQAADSGGNEAMRRAYARQVEAIPDHRHVVAERGRHFVQLDDPDFLAAQVLDFLARIEEADGHE
ncbi:alpha/beta hydrolase [Wenzhouxiangella sp. XN79A]|uniref:alpha/beta fold hydrolase n=1 Tax=Wenzhouxiangella sp. XN79A TaxID=2724193 RepID=UPI00144A67F0|nr:alpha/beta fold hydrolase [Wenzhouxiangella sp. XN79A]NKI33621.1 alpha/beta hydrolase [Wenzhouxiangella sp. XN79A]